jgi:hypothetical protein
MNGLRACKRQSHAAGVVAYMKQLYGLVVQQFARLQDSSLVYFQSPERV